MEDTTGKNEILVTPSHKMAIRRLRYFHDFLRFGLQKRTVGKKIYKMLNQQERIVKNK